MLPAPNPSVATPQHFRKLISVTIGVLNFSVLAFKHITKTHPPLASTFFAMTNYTYSAASALGLALLLVGATTSAATVQVPVANDLPPVAFTPGESGRPAFLRQMKTRYEAPGIIGESQAGWFCSRRGDLVWNQNSSNLLLPMNIVSSRFRTELEHAGYPVPVISDAVFEEKKAPGSDKTGKNALQVGIFIKEIASNLCAKGSGEWMGESYLKIHWEVFAPELQKVVFETTTDGSFKSGSTPVKGLPSAFAGAAFSMATRNLLADPGFLKAVVTPMSTDTPSAAATGAPATTVEKLQIDGAAGTDEPLPHKITQLRSAVATVFGETGSGTGFFVGNNGLLLTNQHVVGKAKFVKVKLATGRELVGEVLRSDSTRDVALVKTEQVGVPPIALRTTDAAIGEDVFALGSPLGETFNSTLTKGILSGVRDLGNLSYLQSDVAILPGNSGGPLLDKNGQAIGITVMGLGAKGLAGMNFFIPIGDALAKLDVQVTSKK